MQIVQLKAENIKRIKAVTITPKGKLVRIAGKNGQGKSSVLDAIWWALAGATHIQAVPIRKGAERAVIHLDLGELLVERRFSGKGSDLIVESKEGARFKGPQGILDGLIGALSFDPLEFARMPPKEQAAALKRLVKMEVDLDVLDGKRARLFEERTGVNRDAANLKATAAGIVVPPYSQPAEGEPATVAEAQAIFDAILKRNTERADRRRSIGNIQAAIRGHRDAIARCEDEIARITRQIEERKAALDQAEKSLPEPVEEDEDMTKARAAIGEAAARERAQDRQKAKAEAEERAKTAAARAEALTAEIQAIDDAKAEALAKAEMPVPGLGFSADGVTFNGLPLEQAATSEQIRVSLAIAMAANPKLRVIRIKDGSMLDDEGMALVAEAAEKHDYQVWAEVVDGSGKMAVLIEDGEVKADNQPDPEATSNAQGALV